MSELQLRKDNITETRIIETPSQPLGDGEIRVKIDSFAFTANNITYALMGDTMAYWQFFQPSEGAEDGWRILPVWGFADVVESMNNELPEGERLYGYWPTASHLVMQPEAISKSKFIDGVAHRSALPKGYNVYQRVGAEPAYDQAMDNFRSLLFPLHITSYCLADVLQHNEYYSAERVIIISASSKTSIGLAQGLHDDASSPTVVGLTSDRNMEFVSGLNLYDQTVNYDDISTLDYDVPTVIVDMAGNRDVLSAVHKSLGANLKRSIAVGVTHRDEFASKAEINKDLTEFFFAPGHIQMRMKEWGPEEFGKRSMAFMMNSVAKSQSWMKVETLEGLKGMAGIHEDVCNGKISPDVGLIVKM